MYVLYSTNHRRHFVSLPYNEITEWAWSREKKSAGCFSLPSTKCSDAIFVPLNMLSRKPNQFSQI